jgi:predicted NBD/HSP70 family sugar kinase
MTTGANQSSIRAINQRSILAAVFEHGPVFKARLSRLLGISKPAMADNVARLLSLGILREIDAAEPVTDLASQGRKPVLLEINKNFRFIITIDFSYLHSRFELFNLQGESLNSFVIRQTPLQEFDTWVSMCIKAVDTLLLSHNIGPEMLAALSFSSPGIISQDPDKIISSPIFGELKPRVLYQRLRERFDCPVFIKNSTNMAALGEYAQGAGRKSDGRKGDDRKGDSMLYISCGQGLGAGIVLEGRLYEGSRAAAGEIAGFMSPGTFGRDGSLEKNICIEGLLDRLRREAPEKIARFPADTRHERLFEEVLSLWQQGDPFLALCVRDIATELGYLICNAVMLLNCDQVVLGGEYHVFAGAMLPLITEMIRARCIIGAKVDVSQLKERAASLGLVTFCREACFDRLCEPPRDTAETKAGFKEPV